MTDISPNGNKLSTGQIQVRNLLMNDRFNARQTFHLITINWSTDQFLETSKKSFNERLFQSHKRYSADRKINEIPIPHKPIS